MLVGLVLGPAGVVKGDDASRTGSEDLRAVESEFNGLLHHIRDDPRRPDSQVHHIRRNRQDSSVLRGDEEPQAQAVQLRPYLGIYIYWERGDDG